MRKLFRDMFESLDAFGRFWLVLGLGSLAAAALMSFDFGWQVSTKHALFLAILTVVAAFGPMAAEMLFTKGRKGPAIATALICVPLLGIEFYSHAGYTAGLRGFNIETAGVQNTRYDGAQDDVKRNRDELSMLMAVLTGLQKDAPWAATVKADGLRAQVTTLDKAITEEGNARNGGCKRKCLDLMKQKTEVENRIAVAEKVEDTQKRIADLQGAIDKKRDVANAIVHASSAVAHQNDALKRWVAMAANGTIQASEFQGAAAQESANLAMAIAGTGLPAFALFMAGLFRVKRRDDDDDPTASAETIAPKPLSPAQSMTAPLNLMRVTVGDLNKEKLRRILDGRSSLQTAV